METKKMAIGGIVVLEALNLILLRVDGAILSAAIGAIAYLGGYTHAHSRAGKILAYKRWRK